MSSCTDALSGAPATEDGESKLEAWQVSSVWTSRRPRAATVRLALVTMTPPPPVAETDGGGADSDEEEGEDEEEEEEEEMSWFTGTSLRYQVTRGRGLPAKKKKNDFLKKIRFS